MDADVAWQLPIQANSPAVDKGVLVMLMAKDVTTVSVVAVEIHAELILNQVQLSHLLPKHSLQQ